MMGSDLKLVLTWSFNDSMASDQGGIRDARPDKVGLD